MIYLIYALIATLSSIFGGLIPLYTRAKNIKHQYLIGFASGVLISTALFEMLPEALSKLDPSVFALPVALGFFSLYLVEKAVMIHACTETECDIHHAGWVGMIGLGFESILDGIAIAAGYLVNPVLGLVIAFAVIVHEFPVGFSTSVIMRYSGYSVEQSLFALVLTSVPTVIGALIFPIFPTYLFGPVLAFTAGTFIYIGASDLLPEAHRTTNWTVVSVVLTGALTTPLLGFLLSL